MEMKKILKFIFAILGVLAIATCVVLAIKLPSTFTDLGKEVGLISEKIDENDSNLRGMPFTSDFSHQTNLGSDYKSSYIKNSGDNNRWYCSWGSGASLSEDESYHSFILGWNKISSVYYGSYTYFDKISNVTELSKTDELYKFTYLLMDFDFYQNHTISFGVKPHDSLRDSSLKLITSHNRGESWSVVTEISSDYLQSTKTFDISATFNKTSQAYTRYGLVLESKLDKARLEINNVYAMGV
ncbi:MAG: hypothetical protein MJ222_01950 [Bacilli bacterium]|nr:hypothetical protein [Bacilli bacterium]